MKYTATKMAEKFKYIKVLFVLLKRQWGCGDRG